MNRLQHLLTLEHRHVLDEVTSCLMPTEARPVRLISPEMAMVRVASATKEEADAADLVARAHAGQSLTFTSIATYQHFVKLGGTDLVWQHLAGRSFDFEDPYVHILWPILNLPLDWDLFETHRLHMIETIIQSLPHVTNAVRVVALRMLCRCDIDITPLLHQRLPPRPRYVCHLNWDPSDACAYCLAVDT